MEDKKALICKEPELIKKISQLREKIISLEEDILNTIEKQAMIEIKIQNFYKKEYLPKLEPYYKRLETLKHLIFNTDSEIKYNKRPTYTNKDSEYDQNELKSLYRKLAKLYHPDRYKNPQDKKFFKKRMAEINQAFIKKDIATLKRLFKKSRYEIHGEISSLKAIESLHLDFKTLEIIKKEYNLKLEKLKNDSLLRLMNLNENEKNAEFEKIKKELEKKIDIYTEILINKHQTLS
jgi:hypothetical protein